MVSWMVSWLSAGECYVAVVLPQASASKPQTKSLIRFCKGQVNNSMYTDVHKNRKNKQELSTSINHK